MGTTILGNPHMGSWQCDNLPLAGKYPAIEAFFSKKRWILAKHEKQETTKSSHLFVLEGHLRRAVFLFEMAPLFFRESTLVTLR